MSLECAHIGDDIPREDILVGKVSLCNISVGAMGKNNFNREIGSDSFDRLEYLIFPVEGS